MIQYDSAHPQEVLAEAKGDSWDDLTEVEAGLGEHMASLNPTTVTEASQTGKKDDLHISKAGKVEGKEIITLQHLRAIAVAT